MLLHAIANLPYDYILFMLGFYKWCFVCNKRKLVISIANVYINDIMEAGYQLVIAGYTDCV